MDYNFKMTHILVNLINGFLSGEEPFILINSYCIHDVSKWRDLNPKFILQTYRDALSTNGILEKQFVQDMYDVCHEVMIRTIKTAVDKDGLIINGGTPDQTFDAWIMTGVRYLLLYINYA